MMHAHEHEHGVDCEGGMDMSGMAGMDMGCDSMDHSMTPMMLIQAQGEVKAGRGDGLRRSRHGINAAMPCRRPRHGINAGRGHAGPRYVGDAGRGHASGPRHVDMPAEAMPPGHDMSNMPAESDATGTTCRICRQAGHTAVKGLLSSQDGYTFTPENTRYRRRQLRLHHHGARRRAGHGLHHSPRPRPAPDRGVRRFAAIRPPASHAR